MCEIYCFDNLNLFSVGQNACLGVVNKGSMIRSHWSAISLCQSSLWVRRSRMPLQVLACLRLHHWTTSSSPSRKKDLCHGAPLESSPFYFTFSLFLMILMDLLTCSAYYSLKWNWKFSSCVMGGLGFKWVPSLWNWNDIFSNVMNSNT